ncbi:hypothetical protein [Streptomyces sp. NPDC057554]|uniref:hypothetical protein n=1 Tax=Streptomyces sp. NPDC057554 TaxID=3350538 RepID=UPI003674FB99
MPTAVRSTSLREKARGLYDGAIDILGEREPYVDDGLLEWREPGADMETAWDMEEMNRRYGFG